MATNAPINANTVKSGRDVFVDFFLVVVILAILSLAAILGFLLLSRSRSTIVPQDISFLQPTDDPIQSSVTDEAANPVVWEENGMTWTIQPQASYQIAARVLGNKRYYDWQSGVVPRDLALGWGDMSEPSVDEWIHWEQFDRLYHYEWNNGAYSRGYITGHSANVHIIPATDNLDEALRQVEKNELVYLEGYLVDLQVRDGSRVGHVNTSLSREDTGAGAKC
ncbi:MAG: hypothetical protein CSA11_02565 [Chloroflexi bacterium]|nr:MAG: hypothetical protein CSA11_02565 [Chloroflexota bacterium]